MAFSPKQQALEIWHAAVDAVRPFPLIHQALKRPEMRALIDKARRIDVVGAGKAVAAMACAVEEVLADRLADVDGIVNVPEPIVRTTRAIDLHAARPPMLNEATATGVVGVRGMLKLIERAGPDDLVICLISGGGSALLPAPVSDITIEEKNQLIRQLHAAGADIGRINTVRKHLSEVKGGRLAEACGDTPVLSLILSDVVGDPLEVIASGPTVPDPTTFADALEVLDQFGLRPHTPGSIRKHLEQGAYGTFADTPKKLPKSVVNVVIGNNTLALTAATKRAEQFGYQVLNLGSFLEGETTAVANLHIDMVRSILADSIPIAPPCCVVSGGETTVRLGKDPGLGGRNQEFALAALCRLREMGAEGVVVMSGGTDGEDGPTDAAGAIVEMPVDLKGLDPKDYLVRHDAHTYFARAGGLVRTGLTETNVMDVRVVLVPKCAKLQGTLVKTGTADAEG